MDRASLLFIELLRASIRGFPFENNGTDSEPTIQQAPHLWRLAKQHQVEGMIADQLLTLPDLPMNISVQLMSYLQSLERLSNDMSSVLAKLYKELKALNIHPILVKGHANAALYPNPLLRTVGDIDLYFQNKSDFEKVIEMMSRRGYKIHSETKNSKLLHKAVQMDTFLLECHGQLLYLPMTTKNRVFEEYYSELLKDAEKKSILIDGVPVQVLPAELQLIHTFLHFFGDFLYGGANFKRLLDWYFVVSKYGQAIDQDRLSRLLKEMKLKYQVGLFGELLNRWFELPAESIPWKRPKKTPKFHRDIESLEHCYFDNRVEQLKNRASKGSVWQQRFWKWWSVVDHNFHYRHVIGHYTYKAPMDMLLFRVKETVMRR
ncbi:nucleotidyltransferase family protein [Porphyromonas somerae]|uniref:nucleotidyltransferase domain-containing protein n=1 Tax=Porphyromonas somerae TaxID=322095 RepID=UPI002A74F44D|nr:nucleotidyltransferase family protein [Porphyromonas somerae]MDY3120512.1 nucleotidyltransferase family protein [Porphyromonas somerae]